MMDFPNTKLKGALAKDLVTWEEASDHGMIDLYIYDETIEIIPLYGKQAVVNAYLWRTGHADEIVLPEIDVQNKLLKFREVSDEDEITIFGNHYEIRRSRLGSHCEYEWRLYP